VRSIFLAAVLFLILFSGCSSTYRLNNFHSKEEFYEDFNHSVKSKEVKITLTNDSSFISTDGIVIENDTLSTSSKLEEKKNRRFALLDIAEINYISNEYKSASVLLKNDEELRVENIRIFPDSIHFVEIKSLITINDIPIDKVKKAGYKNRWINIFPGAIAGLLSGGIIGLLRGKAITNSHGESQELMGSLFGASVGLITGGIVGYILGYTINYQFNP